MSPQLPWQAWEAHEWNREPFLSFFKRSWKSSVAPYCLVHARIYTCLWFLVYSTSKPWWSPWRRRQPARSSSWWRLTWLGWRPCWMTAAVWPWRTTWLPCRRTPPGWTPHTSLFHPHLPPSVSSFFSPPSVDVHTHISVRRYSRPVAKSHILSKGPSANFAALHHEENGLPQPEKQTPRKSPASTKSITFEPAAIIPAWCLF